MSILNVLTYPDKRLRDKSKTITKVTPAIQKLAQDMFETMYHQHGIGLAAPQIGKTICLVVVDVPIEDPIDPEKIIPNPIALINPILRHTSGTIQYDEGCLSCPEITVSVNRAEHIKVAYIDLNGNKLELEASGLRAICIQHEIDHLNGVLLVDKLSRSERELYKKNRIQMIKHGNKPESVKI